MGGGGSGNSTNVTRTEPPAYLQPYYTDIANQAQGLSGKPNEYYPGQTYASLSPESEGALQWQTQRALAGSPVTSAAQSELTKTLGGGYLDPETNPYFNKAADLIQARMGGMFSGSGNFGGGAHANQYRESLTDLGAKTYGDERQRMTQAMMFAPQLANQDYYDISQLGAVGGAREGYSQQGINEAMQRFNFDQMEPWQRLQLYQGILTGQPGGVSTSIGQQPGSSIGNRLAGGLAGGLGGWGAATGLLSTGMASPWAWPLIGGSALLGMFGS